ncbi:DNA helicase recq [Penicillium frequentans]|nr:DNA helicase recq [Penicillium glabrum]
MASRIGLNPEDALIQDLFHYHEPSRVMICSLCQCIVLDIPRHLRVNKAHQEHPVILTPSAVLRHFQKFPARVQACEDLNIPTEQIPAIPHLPIDRHSLQCRIGDCNWIGRTAQRMQEHIRNKHHSTHFNHPGPTSRDPQGAWTSICSQQYTVRGPGAQRFAVLVPSDDSAPSPVERRPVSTFEPAPASLPTMHLVPTPDPTLLNPALAPLIFPTGIDTGPLARARRRIDQSSSRSAAKTSRQSVPQVVIPGPAREPTNISPPSLDPISSPSPPPLALGLVALDPVVIDPVAPRLSISAVTLVHVLLKPVVVESVAAIPRPPLIALPPIELPVCPPAPPLLESLPSTTSLASISTTRMNHAISTLETPHPSQSPTSLIIGTSRTSSIYQLLHDAVEAWADGCPLCRLLGKTLSEQSHSLDFCTQSKARGIRKQYNRIATFLEYSPPGTQAYCPKCLLPPTICGGSTNPNLPSPCRFPRVVMNTVNAIIMTDDYLVSQYVVPWMESDGLDPDPDDRDIAYRWFASEKEIDGLQVPVVTHLLYRFYEATRARRPAPPPSELPRPAIAPQTTSRVATPNISSPKMHSSGRQKKRKLDL